METDEEVSPRPLSCGVNALVRLNVGGTRFDTTVATLVSDPDSILAAMFGRLAIDDEDEEGPDVFLEPARRDDSGAYFIDRSPDVFKVILEFLRTKKLFDFPGIDRARIREEAEYFGLDSMLEALKLGDQQKEEEELRRRNREERRDRVSKKVIVYSLRALRVTECLTVRPGESFSSKSARSPAGQPVFDAPYRSLQPKNVFFQDRLEQDNSRQQHQVGVSSSRLDQQVKILQLAKTILDHFDNYFLAREDDERRDDIQDV